MAAFSYPDAASTALCFRPPRGLRSPHLQTVLGSSFLRRRRLDGFARRLDASSRMLTLECREGARLTAHVSTAGEARAGHRGENDAPLAILLHGWLGCADSTYMLTLSRVLMARGLRVARLNLRDHGGSEHLNPELFHSARIGEVIDACARLREAFGAAGTVLMGCSLGGNFALRVAAANALPLEGCLAICPVMNPHASTHRIDHGWFAYRRYFLGRWRKTLRAKAHAFPERYDFSAAMGLKSIASLTEHFVEHYTDFRDLDDYFARYRIDGERLASLSLPCWILTAADDPVIPLADFRELPPHPALRLFITRYGGHCGFLRNLAGDSLIEETALDFLASADVGLARFGESPAAL